MPGPIRTVTISAPDVAQMVDLYGQHLGYRVIEEGTVPAAHAATWGTPAVASRPYAVMTPAGAPDGFLRFVEGPATGYRAYRHTGWCAAEHIVMDVDALALRLADAPFKVIGPPADLSFSDKIRAMQVEGPAGEVLYLTQIKARLPGLDTPEARHFVDRVFIMIVGGTSLDALMDFYHDRFAVPRTPVIDSVVSVLSRAYGLDPATRHRIAALPIGGQSFIEADQMPAAVLPRTAPPGELPPAIAMVSFTVPELPVSLTWRAAPQRLEGATYGGRRAAVCIGAAGELIELVEEPG